MTDRIAQTPAGLARFDRCEAQTVLRVLKPRINRWFVWLFMVPTLGLVQFTMTVAAIQAPSPTFLAFAVLGPLIMAGAYIGERSARHRRVERLLARGDALFQDAVVRIDPTALELEGTARTFSIPWDQVDSWKRHGTVIEIESKDRRWFVPTGALEPSVTNTLEHRLLHPVERPGREHPSPDGPRSVEGGVVAFHIDETLLARGTRIIQASPVVQGRRFAVALNLIALALFILGFGGRLPATWWLAIALLLASILVASRWLERRKLRRQLAALGDATRFRLRANDAGFTLITGDGVVASTRWRDHRRWIDGGDVLVAETTGGAWSMLPIGEFPPHVATTIRDGLRANGVRQDTTRAARLPSR
ncbi:MAG: hypothetical protein ACRBI6_07425 [Acidimicrobiales bacterium]